MTTASVTLKVHYATRWGETLLLERLVTTKADREPARELLTMSYEHGGFWSFHLTGLEPGSVLDYRYHFRSPESDSRQEPAFRRLKIAEATQYVRDFWLPPELPDGAFLRQAFAGVIFNPSRTAVTPVEPARARRFRLTIRAPRVDAGFRLCVCGSHPMLGSWQPERALVMSGEHYPAWELDLPADDFSQPMEFKFGLWNEREHRLTQLESGPNRWFEGAPPQADVTVLNCEHYEHDNLWRGAGVAIPVFSLRSRNSYGIGEFADLALFAQWAARCKLHLVQLLPINDTSSDFSWRDSYPYKAISTAALHPVYLNIEQLYAACEQPLPPQYEQRREALNELPQLDYEIVLKEKLEYMRELFARVGQHAIARAECQEYLKRHASWLQPYAAFCRLRDLHGTAEFARWGQHATYAAHKIAAWFRPGAPERDSVLFYCWVQYHLDRQLGNALVAGHALGVAFKGDLPIGIDRASVEAWTEPELFRMDRQTGAPPDAFAVLGQNWGFPTYYWRRMEADGYAWWRWRLQRMAETFDALRIDHILGFFRIWEIPIRYKEGILGHFNPALPLSREEIQKAGFNHDPALYTAEAQQAAHASAANPGDAAIGSEDTKSPAYEALFLEDPDQPGRFHPRINLDQTALFQALAPADQVVMRSLHDDFFHRRHTQFWAAEAMKKLPVLMDASAMLICGEDLGMVPDSVPIVLKRLGLLSLEVQRWPKMQGILFGTPRDYPYLSVCTTSTHDMSTIRGWWEEEPETRQRFYNDVMRLHGSAPAECSAEICRFIVSQNLGAKSMWCILPLQDWLGIDARLRHPAAAEERINVPAVPRHYWRYRMHLSIEALLEAEDFNRSVLELVESSGRA